MHKEEKPMVKKLSKGVLDLKFMKKSKEKAQLLEENEERQNLYQDQLSSLLQGADRIVMVNSYYDCMDFLPSRLSFGGMDPDIEKLNEDKLTGLYKVIKPPPPETVTKMDTDVTAAEMAKQYNPTNKYSKRKSDHLEDINAKREASDEDQLNMKRIKNGRGKPAGFKNQTRPIFQDHSRGRGNFRGGNQRGSNFRGNFRGRGRGRGNFRGNFKGQDNFRGNNNNRGQDEFHGNKSEQDNFRGNKSEQDNFRGNKSEQDNFRGNKREQDNFRGNKREQDNFRGNKREHDNFRGNKREQANFRGNKREQANFHGNKREQDNLHGGNSENQGTEGNMQNKKIKFMKPQE